MTGNIKWWQRLCSMALVVFMLFGSVPSSAVAYAADQLNTDNSVVEQSVDPLATAEPTAEAPTETPTATDAPTEQPTAEATAAPEASAAPEATAIAAAMNAAEITGSSEYNGVTVNVVAPIGAFPEGTTLSITPVTAQQDVAAVSNAVEQTLTDTQTLAQATTFDIVFSYNGKEVQPADGKTVSVSFAMPQAIDTASEQLQVYRTEDAATATADTIEQVTASAATDNAVTVEAEHFTSYTVTVVASNGNSFAETVANGETFTLNGTNADRKYRHNISDTWTITSGASCIRLDEKDHDNADYVAIDIGSATVVHDYVYYYSWSSWDWGKATGRETFTITIVAKVDGVTTNETMKLDVGGTASISASVVPSGAVASPTYTYSSSDSSVAAVSSSGVVTGVAAGTATITTTLTVNNQTYTDTTEVTVVSRPTSSTDTSGQAAHSKTIVYDAATDTYKLALDVSGTIASTSTPARLDVVFILDVSGSMGDNGKLATAKRAINGLVSTLKANDAIQGQYALVTFSGGKGDHDAAWNDAAIQQGWNDGTSLLQLTSSDNDTLDADGGTNYQAGLLKAQDLLANDHSDATKVLIFLTDGAPTYYYSKTDASGGDGYTRGYGSMDYGEGAWHSCSDAASLTAGTAAFANSMDRFYAVTCGANDATYALDANGVTGKAAAANSSLTTQVINADVDTLVGKFSDIAADITSVSCKQVAVTDTLSQYVDYIDGSAQLVVYDSATGEKVALNDSSIGLSTTANYIAVSGKTITATLPSTYELKPGYTYTVECSVKPSAAAYAYYALHGAYPNTGDAGTDGLLRNAAGDKTSTANTTSAGKAGFNSNTGANVSYMNGTTPVSQTYDNPVVQVKMGALTVSKTVTGLDTAALAELEKAGGLTLSYSSAASANVSAAAQAGNVTLAQIVAAGGKTASGSSVTYSYTFNNLPAGSYTVAESGEGLANYNLSSSGFGTAVVTAGGTVSKAVTNAYTHKTAALTVKKTINGLESASSYNITLTVPSMAGQNVKIGAKTVALDAAGAASFSVTAGGSVKISGLWVGASYTVTEAAGAWYDTSYSANAAGTISADATVTVTNTYKAGTKSVSVQKVWANDSAAAPAGVTAVVFTLTGKTSTGKTNTITTSLPTNNANKWQGTFALPKYAPDGSEYVYTLAQESVTYNGAAVTAATGTKVTLGNQVYFAAFAGDETNGFTVTNTLLNGSFSIYKQDDAKQPVSGAAFKLYSSYANGVLGGTAVNLTSNASGLITFEQGSLTAGAKYYLQEVSAPDAYLADTASVYVVEVSADGASAKVYPYAAGVTGAIANAFNSATAKATDLFAITNARKTGTITVTKAADTGAYDAGQYTFTVSDPASVLKVSFSNGTGTYSNGTISMPKGVTATITALYKANITVTETTTAPANYTLETVVTSTTNNGTVSGKAATVASVGSGAVYAFSYKNTYTRNTASLTVVKSFTGVANLNDLQIELVGKDGTTEVDRLTLTTASADRVQFTAAGGTYTWVVSGAKVGASYTATETAGFGFNNVLRNANDAISASANCTADSKAAMTIRNNYTALTGTLTFAKHDALTNGALAGATFTLNTKEDFSGDTVATAVSQADGSVTFANLKVGTYYMKETGAPADYQADAKVYRITVVAAELIGGVAQSSNVTVTMESRSGLGWSAVAAVNGAIALNNTPKTQSVSATKTWADNSNQDGKRPSSVSFQLYKTVNGTTAKVGSAVSVSGSGDVWTASWKNMPIRENGSLIVYSVKEVVGGSELADGSSFNAKSGDADSVYTVSYTGALAVTNTHAQVTIELPVTKVWADDANHVGLRAQSVTFTLYQQVGGGAAAAVPGENGGAKTVSLSADNAVQGDANKWAGSFTGLPKYTQNGKTITYSVKESVNGTEYADGDTYNAIANDADTQYAVAIENSNAGCTVTNSHANAKTAVTVEKAWVDNNNQDGKRPAEITVNLLQNGAALQSQTISADASGKWSYTFTGLDKFDGSGSLYAYTVSENPVTDYTPSAAVQKADALNTWTITNTHTPNVTGFTVTKNWNDANDQDGVRPASVTVQLYKTVNGVTSSMGAAYQETLSANNGDWSYTWSNLAQYEGGKEVAYSVQEVGTLGSGYTAQVSGGTITNSRTTDTTSVTVEKAWGADTDDSLKQPVVVGLFRGDVQIGVAKLNANNKWTYTWTELQKNETKSTSSEATKAILYTVKELVDDVQVSNGSAVMNGVHYDVALTGSGSENEPYILTNTPQTASVTLTKTVEVDKNTDNIFPADKTYTLQVALNGGTLNLNSTGVTVEITGTGSYGADTVTLANGASAKITAPKGIVINVTEDISNAEVAGFDFPAVAYNVDGTAASVAQAVVGTNGTMEVVNTYTRSVASLNIAKASDEASPVGADAAFTMNVHVDGAAGSYTANGGNVLFNESGNATVTLHANESITIDGLPAGAAYSVTEQQQNWFKASYDDAQSGNLGTHGEIAATVVTNAYTPNNDPKTVTVEKNWVNGSAPEGLDAITLTLSAADTTPDNAYEQEVAVQRVDGNVWSAQATVPAHDYNGNLYSYEISAETANGSTLAKQDAESRVLQISVGGKNYEFTASFANRTDAATNETIYAVSNTPRTSGQLIIVKVDGQTQNTTALAGAKFQLYQGSVADANKVGGEMTSDAYGIVAISGLQVGNTYVLKETQAPAGYQANDGVYEITVSSDGDVASVFYQGNGFLEGIQNWLNSVVSGWSSRNNDVEVVFSAAVPNASATTKLEVVKNWDASKMQLDHSYDEVAASVYGQLADNAGWLIDAGNGTYSISDSKAAYDTAYLNSANGFKSEWNAVPTYVNGKAITWSAEEDLIDGTTTQPSGVYTASSSTEPLKDNFGAVIGTKVTLTNTPVTQKISLTKTVTGAQVKDMFGFTITMQDWVGAAVALKESAVTASAGSDVIIHSSNGIVTSIDVRAGSTAYIEVPATASVTVSESDAAVADYKLTTTVNGTEASSYTDIVVADTAVAFNNDYQPVRGSLYVSKTEAQTGAILTGAEFTLYGDAQMQTVYGKLTEENGSYTIENLPVGTYYLKETAAPAGYELNATVYKVVVASDNANGNPSSSIAVVTVTAQGVNNQNTADDPLVVEDAVSTGSLTVTKDWNDDSNRDNLRGDVTVTLYENRGGEWTATTQQKTLTYDKATASNAQVTFENLPLMFNGEAIRYKVVENKLPGYADGYTGNDVALLGANGTPNINVTNTHNAATISSITVTKSYSANTPASLQREVKLALYANGTKLAETTTQGLTAEFTNLKVNENGAAIQYVVKEWDENTQNYVGSGETAYIGGIAFTVGGGAVTLSSQPNEANQYTGTAAVSNAMQVTSGDADLVITKNVEGTTDNTPAHTFYFEVALKDGTEAPIAGTFGENTFDANGIARVSVDIAEGQTLNTVTLTGLPVGANYTVTEMTDANYTTAMTAGTAVSGYTLASGNAVGGTLNKNGTNAQSFTNTYATNPVAVKVSATKTMTGRKLTAEDTFKANLYQVSANGTVAGTAKLSAALTGDAAGATTDTFAFGSLNFTDAADAVTYYAIQEVKDGKGVTTWDGTVADATGTQADMPDHFFRVTLTDNGTGSLSAVVETGSFANGAFVPDAAALTADENGTYNVASVTNDYQASDTLGDDGTLPLNFAKKIIGRSMNANDVGAYTFTLTPANAESPLRIQTANGFDATKTSVEAANTGAVSDNASAIHFADLVFTQDDIGKTFQYKVAETAKTGDVTTMDSGYYLIDVSVAYAAGELSAQVAGIRYVKDGTTVSLTADAQLPFTNNYTGSAEATISATKLLTANGHAYPLHQSFTFNLYEQTADGEKLIDTKSTAVGSANVTFDTIAYTNAKEGDVHTYLVKEAAPADGYAFATDGTSKTITVTLKYDTAAKQLVPEYKVDGVLTKAADAADGSVQPDVTIANTYAAVNTNAKVTISGSKLLLVNDEETQSNLAGFRFKAELLSATGAEGQDLKGTYEALHGTAALTAASDANGEFSFDEIVYTLDDLYTSTAYTTSATYLYKVTETRPDSNTFYGYDTRVFYYEVTLTDDTLGNLTAATQTYLGAGEDRTPADGIVFTNTANTTTATIRKDWVDINNALGGRPDSITVRVAAYYYDGNGNPVYVTDAVKDALGGSFHEKTAESYAYSAFTVTKDTDWTLLLENLPVEYYVAADDTTYELTYSASEEGMEDYETSYEDLTITNTVRVGAINIAKIVTDGKTYEGDESFTFNVYRVNGEKSILAAVKTIYYNGNENSSALLAGLPYGTYRIEEVKSMGAERYTTTITADGKVGDTVTLNKDLTEVTVTVTNTLSNTDYTTDTATVVNRYVYGSGWVQEFVNMPEDLNANEKSGRDDSPVAENQKAVLLPQKDQRVSNPTQGNDGDGAGGSGDGGADGPEPVNT